MVAYRRLLYCDPSPAGGGPEPGCAAGPAAGLAQELTATDAAAGGGGGEGMSAWGVGAGAGCWAGFLCPASGACVAQPARCPEGDPLRRSHSVYADEVRRAAPAPRNGLASRRLRRRGKGGAGRGWGRVGVGGGGAGGVCP